MYLLINWTFINLFARPHLTLRIDRHLHIYRDLSIHHGLCRASVYLLFCIFSNLLVADSPEVQLANIYHEAHHKNIQDFLVSEKFDGIRAIWRNGQLRTRNGTLINAPRWFTEPLPDHWLDGELWSKRQDFEFISSVVRKKEPLEQEWRQINYMVFDAPDYSHPFQYRANFYQQLLIKEQIAHVKPVKQWQIATNDALFNLLKQLTEQGAEGLMLHRKTALFHSDRTNNLIKLKPYMDAEAVVLGHVPGKGKYRDALGALLVGWHKENGKKNGELIKFKIGTGFTDQERKEPPAVGTTITFKYHGLTKNGIPRFASYLRIKQKIQ